MSLNEYQTAKDEYLAAHPPPSVLDFTCPRCHAEPGRACSGLPEKAEHGHAPRQDKAIRARQLRELDAANAADNRA